MALGAQITGSFRIPILLPIALMSALGCARQFPATQVTTIKASTPDELQKYLLAQKPDVAQFRSRGPFTVVARKDLQIPVASDLTVEADFYLCVAAPIAAIPVYFARSTVRSTQ